MSDEKILSDLEELSGGKLKLSEGTQLNEVAEILSSLNRRKRPGKSSNNQRGRQNYKRRNNNYQ